MPSEEQTYREGIDDRIKRFEQDMRESATRQEVKLDSIEKKVSYTNGKVRKIIIAIVLVFGILIGQNFTSTHDVIQLFSSAF